MCFLFFLFFLIFLIFFCFCYFCYFFIFLIYFFHPFIVVYWKTIICFGWWFVAADPMLCILYRMLMKYLKNKKNKVFKKEELYGRWWVQHPKTTTMYVAQDTPIDSA